MTTWLEKTNTKEVQWMEENYANIYIYMDEYLSMASGHGAIFLYKSRWQAKTQNQRTIWKIISEEGEGESSVVVSTCFKPLWHVCCR